jgi:hypothetical protein
MSTKMTETDWAAALEVFRASLPRRGAKGRDDLLFLEALHYFSVHNITWRALPERVRQMEQRLETLRPAEQGGRVRGVLRSLAALSSSAHLVQMFDSTVVRAMSRRQAQKGAAKSGARPLARRLLDQNPPEDGFRRPSDRLRPDRRREGDAPPLSHPARLGPDIDPRAPSATRATPARPTVKPHGLAAPFPSSRTRPTQR